jgi:hypothetical protein
VLWLVTSVAAHAFFWSASQTAGADRLVQRVRQHFQFRSHVRHAPTLIQQLLRLLQHFPFQHRGGTVARLRLVESLGPMLPVQLHIPLHRDHRHAECLHDLFGLHRPAFDHLTGEHTETPHILLLVLEHRQVAMQVKHLARLRLYRDPAIDLRHPGGENRQLQLRHSSLLSHCRQLLQLFFRLIPFSLAGENYGDEIRRSELGVKGSSLRATGDSDEAER